MTEAVRAEEEPKIVVSRYYPNRIGSDWNCIYKIFCPDYEQRILLEFEDLLLADCALQNITITDDKTGRVGGPYCGDVRPPNFISDCKYQIQNKYI
jgi:hypothetical protein